MVFRKATTSEKSHIGELRKFKTEKLQVTGEMINGVGERVVNWIWRVCNMAFKNIVVPEDCRSAMIILLYKGKGERNECSNY